MARKKRTGKPLRHIKERQRQREANKGKKSSTQQAIGERNRIALAFMELSKDKTFTNLTDEHKLKLVREVLAIGDEVANWVMAEYGSNDPRKVAIKMGVKIFGENGNKGKGTEYRKESKEIIVYRSFHEKLIEKVQAPELSENLLKFLVAHELFHHLEMSRIGEIFKRYKFRVWSMGPFSKEKFIKGLSRVSAHAFTWTLLGLEISPQVFDYLTYILSSNSLH